MKKKRKQNRPNPEVWRKNKILKGQKLKQEIKELHKEARKSKYCS